MEISAQKLSELLDYERFLAKLQAAEALQKLGYPVNIDEHGTFYSVGPEYGLSDSDYQKLNLKEEQNESVLSTRQE